MTTYVISRPDLRDADLLYVYGDRFDRDEFAQRYSHDLAQQLQLQGYFVPANRDSVAVQLARRPADAPWPPRGFTVAELEDVYGVPPRAKTASTATRPAKVIDTVEIPADAIPVGRFFLVKQKSGVGYAYTPIDAEGRLLRDKAIRDLAKATAFLEEIEAIAVAASTAEPAADTSESKESDEEGKGNDGDVQS